MRLPLSGQPPTFTVNGRVVQKKSCTTVIPVFWRLKQKNEFKASLGYVGDPVSNTHPSKKMLKRKRMRAGTLLLFTHAN